MTIQNRQTQNNELEFELKIISIVENLREIFLFGFSHSTSSSFGHAHSRVFIFHSFNSSLNVCKWDGIISAILQHHRIILFSSNPRQISLPHSHRHQQCAAKDSQASVPIRCLCDSSSAALSLVCIWRMRKKGKWEEKKSFPSTRRSLYRVYVAKLLCWSLVIHNRHSCSFSSSSRWMILLSLLAVIRSGYPGFFPSCKKHKRPRSRLEVQFYILRETTQHCRKWSLWVGAEQDRKKQRKI